MDYADNVVISEPGRLSFHFLTTCKTVIAMHHIVISCLLDGNAILILDDDYATRPDQG